MKDNFEKKIDQKKKNRTTRTKPRYRNSPQQTDERKWNEGKKNSIAKGPKTKIKVANGIITVKYSRKQYEEAKEDSIWQTVHMLF